MEALELYLTVGALLMVALLATLAVFSPHYSDTTLQRVALAGIAIGALGVAWWCWQGRQAPGPVAVLAVACALFGAETARKIVRRLRSGTWTQRA